MMLKRIANLFSLVIFILFSCKSRFITPVNQPVSEEKGNAEVNIIAEKKDFSAAISLYETACFKCHDLNKPSDYKDEEWIPIMEDMAPKANLTKDQHHLILEYFPKTINFFLFIRLFFMKEAVVF